jgi:hypothetical protein
MPDSIPTDFTPCLDPLLQEYGPIGACVYGRVWRYAQMRKGICEASHDTIAGGLNITRRTVWRWIKILCDDGYLVDLTPTVTNHPHKYQATDKISTVIELHTTVNESHTADEGCANGSQQGVNESHSHCANGSHEETERSSKESKDQESATADLLPTNFQGWHLYIKEAANRGQTIHRIRQMCGALYPGLDPPEYAYVGRVAKRLHAGRLADLLWQAAPHPPTGDLLAYIQAIAKRGNGKTGESSSDITLRVIHELEEEERANNAG